jgi:RNA polymerase sigma-70 factor, ECF subfamily
MTEGPRPDTNGSPEPHADPEHPLSSKSVLEEHTSGAALGAAPGASAADGAAELRVPGGGGALDFRQVYVQHFQFVWRSLRLLGVPPESLEDAAQDTFAVVSRQLADFEGRSSLSTWIFAIGQRVAANHRRTRRRKLLQLRPLDEPLPGNEPAPDAAVEAAQAARSIEAFVAGLDEPRRALFILALMEGVPATEIAALEQTSVNTIYSRIRLLRQELKAFLDRAEVRR